ncbi:DUF6438 domain-containing protein [uncultured Polaribacter sp.]|uniref:DUF6438 domain-containing protein n=1 Tax=uncultured Polaribacter sp. TaxID=174711 RepID=UPI0026391130|nr:DUF6438 domain-containing protein [uncultured Polaribacter sp.]
MKLYFLLFFLVVLTCSQSKNEPSVKNSKKNELIIEDLDALKENNFKELILVLKNPKEISDIKEILIENNLTISNLIANKKTYKAAIISVPSDNFDFWNNKLKKTNLFSTITLNTEAVLNSVKNLAENTLINVIKTSCFGDCPVFEVTFFKNGEVQFFGKEFVLVEGATTFTLEKSELKKLNDMFEKTMFKDFEDAKETDAVKDFSDTFITYNDEQIKIILWRNIPDEIAYAYDYIEELLLKEKLIE